MYLECDKIFDSYFENFKWKSDNVTLQQSPKQSESAEKTHESRAFNASMSYLYFHTSLMKLIPYRLTYAYLTGWPRNLMYSMLV